MYPSVCNVHAMNFALLCSAAFLLSIALTCEVLWSDDDYIKGQMPRRG